MTREFAAGRPKRAPTHPGSVLRETVLPALKMSVADAATHLGVTRQTLHRILSERASITPEMAIRLGKFCGNGPTLWLRMQQNFDLWQASEKLGAEVARIPTFKDAA
jgi:addiction module HigA family antidote